jgi:uncharacterized protein
MKPSSYNFFVSSFFDGWVIAYNSLWGSFFTMSEEEMRTCKGILDSLEEGERVELSGSELIHKLIELKFIVDDPEDEQMEAKNRYARFREESQGLSLTIAPTVNCNFRCSYCFQEPTKKRMTQENIDSIIKYIDKNLNDGNSLHITWFGGEPLLAFDVIVGLCDILHQLCKGRKCDFTQSMITNGSLLDDNKIDFLVAEGNFKDIQITLDGPPEFHDQRRPTRGNRATFYKILENIKRVSDKVPITIRVNIDKTNYHSLEQLVDILIDHGLRNRVHLYLGHVLPYTEACSNVESIALAIEEFAEIESKFQFHLLQRGFLEVGSLPKPRKGNLCVADNSNGAVLAPDNLVFRCWNEVAMSSEVAVGVLKDQKLKIENKYPSRQKNGFASELYQDKIMEENNRHWDSYNPFCHEICQDCKVLPLCHGGCPWEARKNPEEGTGHCTPLKFNLPDKLRIYHMQNTLSKVLRTNEN